MALENFVLSLDEKTLMTLRRGIYAEHLGNPFEASLCGPLRDWRVCTLVIRHVRPNHKTDFYISRQ